MGATDTLDGRQSSLVSLGRCRRGHNSRDGSDAVDLWCTHFNRRSECRGRREGVEACEASVREHRFDFDDIDVDVDDRSFIGVW